MASSDTPLLHTPLHSAHVAAGGRMVPFAGYAMPVRYGSQVEEHHAVRRAAGLFDVSHMGEVFVRGQDAESFLQQLTPNNVSKLAIGQAQYSALLNERAGFIDDLLVYRMASDEFMLVINAAGRSEDVPWISERASGHDVEVADRSDEMALIALQGPEALEILRQLCDLDLDNLGYYHFAKAPVAGVDAIVSRTGYTGEDGFELYVENQAAVALWQDLLRVGGPHGLVPAGLAARDTLRLEAGMMLSGQDIGADITPIEAGVGWFVKLKKGAAFPGSERLAQQRTEGVKQQLVGFELEGRAMARTGYPIEVNGIQGVVTSGSWSPTLEKSIGIARIESDQVFDRPAAGSSVTAEVRRAGVEGHVVKLPFYSRVK